MTHTEQNPKQKASKFVPQSWHDSFGPQVDATAYQQDLGHKYPKIAHTGLRNRYSFGTILSGTQIDATESHQFSCHEFGMILSARNLLGINLIKKRATETEEKPKFTESGKRGFRGKGISRAAYNELLLVPFSTKFVRTFRRPSELLFWRSIPCNFPVSGKRRAKNVGIG